MQNLNYLSLRDNQINGDLESEIGNLINLEYLYLYNNGLTGELPVEMSSLVNLVHLYLHNNSFSGLLPNTLNKFFIWIFDSLTSRSLSVCLKSPAILL